MTTSWAEVTCRDCLAKRPGTPVHQCRHCRRPLLGRCVHWPAPDVWLHDTCVAAFERSDEGREILRKGDPYATAKCSTCGRPGEHPDGRPCPKALGAGGR